MLTHLSINNFAIASELEMEFHQGMTVITGETGAGKSIMLDALGLTLGDRSDASVVKQGAERADIHASFDIAHIQEAQDWLEQHDLIDEASNNQECLLRRMITKEGRSRGYINGRPAPLTHLKTLGELLIDIHNQHAHQSLLKKDQQRRLLDEFGGLNKLTTQVKKIAQDYQKTEQHLQTLQNNNGEQTARAQLLGYQIKELDNLALTNNELQELELQQQQLANGEQIQQASQQAIALCTEGELNVVSILSQALRSLTEIPIRNHSLSEAEQLLNSALIQTEEASHELQNHLNGFELDPNKLRQIEHRLSTIYEIARKHKIKPEQLSQLHQDLQREIDDIEGSDADIDALSQQLAELKDRYNEAANKLTKKRKSAATKLQKAIGQQLQSLAMNNCSIVVNLQAKENQQTHIYGNEDISFLVSTNPGQTPQALAKIASGGELSRISLAIQVITAKTSATPTMVFDEVDVGIGGATAEVVGNLLQELGQNGQVLCVTHQPQVACKGHQHLYVSKNTNKRHVSTHLHELDDQEKITEIARMLGGIAITETSLNHAKEMLSH